MKREYWAVWLFLLLLVTSSVIVSVQFSRSEENDRHAQLLVSLYQLKELEAAIDKDILRVLSFQLNNYDSLAESVMRMRVLHESLVSPQSPLISIVNEVMPDDTKAYVLASSEKLMLLEHLKSKAAILRNTLQYLPLAVSQFRELGGQGAESAYAAQLLSRLLAFNLFPEEENRAAVNALIERGQSLALSGVQRKLLDNILHHASTNIATRNDIRKLQQSYSAIPTNALLDGLLDTFHHYTNERANHSYYINIALFALAMLLLAALGYAMDNLRRARSRAEGAWDQLKDAIESIAEAFALYDVNDRLVLWNSNFEEFYSGIRDRIKAGVSYRELLKSALDRGVFKYDEQPDDNPLPALLGRHQKTQQGVLEHLADGRVYLTSDNRTTIGGIASIRVDITERNRMEERLRELYQAGEQSPVSIIITSLDGQIEYVNSKFVETSGHRSEDVVGKNPRLLKAGSESPEFYRRLWQTISSGREWEGEFVNQRKSGELYWESARISGIRDAEGNITHYLAIKEEITARKQAEEQLRLAAKVFDTTSEAIMVTDANNVIKAINPGFTRITGFTQEDVIGKTPQLLSSGHHNAEFYAQMWTSLKDTGSWEGEIWNRRKSGENYPEWLSIATIRNDRNEVVEYVAVFSDITQRKKDEEKIRWQANYDPLTELPNRTLFFDRLSRALASAKRENWTCALLFIDLDRFKVVNDTLGHAMGDKLLRMVAMRLLNCVRDVDSVARHSGDEFTVILQHIGTANRAASIAEKILASLSESFDLDGREIFIGASIGITLYPLDGEDTTALMRNADLAMYQAKIAGRNMYRFFTSEINEQMLGRMRLEHDMRLAIERGQFILHYQPIVSLESGEIVAAEALVRWEHPEQGLLGPDRFISMAEETGLIGELGKWILREACTQARHWQVAGLPPLRMSVNLSNRQLHKGFNVAELEGLLSEIGLEPQWLSLEITESLIMDDTSDVISLLHGIRQMGVGISIDDFGTGFSSLSYLKRLPITTLKIDKSFIDDIHRDPDDASLTEAIIGLARSFGLKVIAEGVETREQLAVLQSLQCDMVQGFFYSRPLSPDAFRQHLEREAATQNNSSSTV